MKIATWNINGVKARIEELRRAGVPLELVAGWSHVATIAALALPPLPILVQIARNFVSSERVAPLSPAVVGNFWTFLYQPQIGLVNYMVELVTGTPASSRMANS